jgi:hypothetical protein
MSAAARKRIAAAQKKRWAVLKKAGQFVGARRRVAGKRRPAVGIRFRRKPATRAKGAGTSSTGPRVSP